jgi:hypothetical protein
MTDVFDDQRSSKTRFQGWFVLLTITLTVGFFILVDENNAMSTSTGDKQMKVRHNDCLEICEALSKTSDGLLVGDIRDKTYCLQAALKERAKLHQKLKDDYGEAFEAMWLDNKSKQVIGKNLFTSPFKAPDQSYWKFKRKLQLKVLEAQIKFHQYQQSSQACNCTQESQPIVNGRRQLNQDFRIQRPLVDFVWATGGHSSAAGHGNLYNETYTAFMERAVKPIFASVGIHFLGRNYAMGGMDSAPQIALCNEAIFGRDADVISWDFGMTDGSASWKTNLYASRAGVHSNRPAFVAINNAGRRYKSRMQMLKLAEDAGVPTLHLLPEIETQVTNSIPDSYGMSEEELDKLGPYARYLKCKGAIEKEDTCSFYKYTNALYCPHRKYMASWHPGWKQLATTGNIIALFLTESLIEALESLQASSDEPEVLYQKLKKEEDDEYELFLNKSSVPDITNDFISDEMVADGLKSHYLFRSKAICKTTLLPAQTRYLGFLTENGQEGDTTDYDHGEDVVVIKRNETQSEGIHHMPLVYEANMRQSCSLELNRDFKDYYIVTQAFGWTSLSFPNEKEIEEYAANDFHPQGIVVLCFFKCDWGRCPRGEVSVDTYNVDWRIELNGQPITTLTKLDQCFVVKSTNGYFHTQNQDGRYDLRILIDPGETMFRYARITSIIII